MKFMLKDLLKILDDFKAEDVVVMDLPSEAGASQIVLASGQSKRHVETLAEKTRLYLRQIEVQCVMEGGSSEWIVLDAGGIFVHMFTPEKRCYYNLEALWGKRKESLSSPEMLKEEQVYEEIW